MAAFVLPPWRVLIYANTPLLLSCSSPAPGSPSSPAAVTTRRVCTIVAAGHPDDTCALTLKTASVCAPGMDNVTCASKMGCAKSQVWLPSDVAVWARRTRGNIVGALTIVLTMPREVHTVYGAPAKVYVQLSFPESPRPPNSSPEIAVEVSWIGKRPTRLPEASMLMLPLAPCPAYRVSLSILDSVPC
jgi:hypothetical protein